MKKRNLLWRTAAILPIALTTISPIFLSTSCNKKKSTSDTNIEFSSTQIDVQKYGMSIVTANLLKEIDDQSQIVCSIENGSAPAGVNATIQFDGQPYRKEGNKLFFLFGISYSSEKPKKGDKISFNLNVNCLKNGETLWTNKISNMCFTLVEDFVDSTYVVGENEGTTLSAFVGKEFVEQTKRYVYYNGSFQQNITWSIDSVFKKTQTDGTWVPFTSLPEFFSVGSNGNILCSSQTQISDIASYAMILKATFVNFAGQTIEALSSPVLINLENVNTIVLTNGSTSLVGLANSSEQTDPNKWQAFYDGKDVSDSATFIVDSMSTELRDRVKFNNNHQIVVSGVPYGEYTFNVRVSYLSKIVSKTVYLNVLNDTLFDISIDGHLKGFKEGTTYNQVSEAFEDSVLIIPAGVTVIDSGAFANCFAPRDKNGKFFDLIKSIYFNKPSVLLDNQSTLVEIGEGAFQNDSQILNNIILPVTLTKIGDFAFKGCEGITGLEIFNYLNSIGKSAFEDCSKLSKFTIPQSCLDIGDYAFSNCPELKQIDVSSYNSLKNFPRWTGRNIFNNHSKDGCFIIDTDKSEDKTIDFIERWKLFLNNQSFASSDWTKEKWKIYYKDVFNISVDGDDVILNGFKDDSNIDDDFIKTIFEDETLVIPDNITTIKNEAFKNKFSTPHAIKSIKNIEVNNNLKKIGDSAFEGCNSIENIIYYGQEKFNPNLQEIGKKAFFECTSLKQARFDDKINTIGDSAFEGCSILDKIVAPVYYDGTNSSMANVGNRAFANCPKLVTIELTNSTLSDGYASVLNWKSDVFAETSLQGVVYITKTDSYSNYNTFLTSCGLSFDKAQETHWWFSLNPNFCFSLTGSTLNSFIDNYDKAQIEASFPDGTLYIPQCVQTIKENAFIAEFTKGSQAQSIEYLNLYNIYDESTWTPTGSTIKSIEASAFSGCDFIKSTSSETSDFTIPSSVEKIGQSAFDGCEGIISLVFEGQVNEISSYAFAYCSGLSSIDLSKFTTLPTAWATSNIFSNISNTGTVYISSTGPTKAQWEELLSKNGIIFSDTQWKIETK